VKSYLPEAAGAERLVDALAHVRNKNLTVDVSQPSFALRGVRRLQRWCMSRERTLLPQTGTRVVVTEQVLENALVLRHLGEARDILDFGGFESTLPLSLNAMGRCVTVLDQRPYPFEAEGLATIQADVLQPLKGLDGAFDLTYSVSTIEHVGLGMYGSPVQDDGDRVALAHLWTTVRPGGRLFFTVPAGRPGIWRGYRVYDEPALRRIMPGAGAIEFFLKPGRFATWRSATPAEIASHVYQHYEAQTPIEGVAFVHLVKPTVAE
jgi:SAM-dependent methyltransferase